MFDAEIQKKTLLVSTLVCFIFMAISFGFFSISRYLEEKKDKKYIDSQIQKNQLTLLCLQVLKTL